MLERRYSSICGLCRTLVWIGMALVVSVAVVYLALGGELPKYLAWLWCCGDNHSVLFCVFGVVAVLVGQFWSSHTVLGGRLAVEWWYLLYPVLVG